MVPIHCSESWSYVAPVHLQGFPLVFLSGSRVEAPLLNAVVSLKASASLS